MKSALGRNVTVAVAAVVVAGGGLAVSATNAAHAAPSSHKPSYEPDHHAVGSITFYNKHGHKITKGKISGGPLAAFAVGSKSPVSGDVDAVLIAAQPHAHENTLLWNTDYLSSFTKFPAKKAPGKIKKLSKKHPVVTGKSSDLSLADFIKEFPSGSKKYKNIYQIRIKVSDGSTLSTTYDVADVLVHGKKWKQIYK